MFVKSELLEAHTSDRRWVMRRIIDGEERPLG